MVDGDIQLRDPGATAGDISLTSAAAEEELRTFMVG